MESEQSVLRLLSVYGTRPEAVKFAPFIRACQRDERLDAMVVVTGQHRSMLDEVNRVFHIVPDVDLNLMKHGQSPAMVTANVLEHLGPVLREARPDAVVVQGDTTTTFASALAAFYEGLPVIHLEAGLRTPDPRMPFPEEMNRRLTSRLADLHLAATPANAANLFREGVASERVIVTGNTGIDALHMALDDPEDFHDPALAEFARSRRAMVLVTAHRRESWGEAMGDIARGIRTIAERYRDVWILFPMHKNPVVRERLAAALTGEPNILLTEPLPYGEFVRAMARADVVVTDSGGVQEEAPGLRKPVLVIRDVTERTEAISAGTARLIGTSSGAIVSALSELLDNPAERAAMAARENPFGDGRASERCVSAIRWHFGMGARPEEFGAGSGDIDPETVPAGHAR